MPRRYGPGLPALSGALLSRVLPVAALLVGALLPATAWPAPAAAQKSLVVESLHADIEVQSDGSILVTERLRPRFTGSWNGIVRHLSLQHTSARGERERLRIQLLSAEDEAGRPLEHEVNRIDDWTREFRVWVPNATDRTATVVLRYRVDGALRFFAGDSAAGSPDYDEAYWRVTGTEWEVPILAASARVRLPPGGDPVQAAAYRGVARSRLQAPVELSLPGDWTGRSTRDVEIPPVGPLEPGEGLTIAVAWTPGAVPVPPGARAAPRPLAELEAMAAGRTGPFNPLALFPLLLPFGALWLAFRAWSRRGRDPKERAVTVQWEPPALSPAEAGTLIDHSPGMHDIISTVVDLAVKGYLVIVEREKDHLFDSRDYAFHLVRPRTEWDALEPHERRFLDGLFEGTPKGEALREMAESSGLLGGLVRAVAGKPATADAPAGSLDSVLLSDLKNEFYKEIPKIKEAILDQLVAKGHYLRRPDQVRIRWGLLAGAAAAVGAVGVTGIASGSYSGFVFGVALLIAGASSALILGIFAAIMPARTEQGARTREAVLGFRQFLERVESPRYRRMITSPDQFERFLPYAVAFRCADKWARAFDGLLTEPPDWYRGGGHRAFNPSVFAADLGGMTRAASSTLSSSPSSSGSGGGGSVGGGSGGGGGGGF